MGFGVTAKVGWHPWSDRRNALRFSALRPGSGPREFDVLGTLPEDHLAQGTQLIEAVDDRQKMVAGKLADLAGEANRAIGKQDLGLTEANGVKQDLARRRKARRVLVTKAEIERPERYPARLAAPPDMD